MPLRAFVLALFSIVLACSAHVENPPAPRTVCDGSPGIRIAFAYLGGDKGMFGTVNHELGWTFVYVDGTCRYWVPTWSSEDRFSEWRPIHTGIISDIDVKTLADSIHYDDLPALVRTCEPPPNVFSEGVFIGLYDGEHALTCPNGAVVLKAAEATWFDLGPKLYAAGRPVVGPLRVVVGTGGDSVITPYPWPLTTPLGNFVVDPMDAFAAGKSKRLSDQSEVAKLLALRERYLQDEAALGTGPVDLGIPIEGGNILYFREDLPFTGEDGLPTFSSSSP